MTMYRGRLSSKIHGNTIVLKEHSPKTLRTLRRLVKSKSAFKQ